MASFLVKTEKLFCSKLSNTGIRQEMWMGTKYQLEKLWTFIAQVDSTTNCCSPGV